MASFGSALSLVGEPKVTFGEQLKGVYLSQTRVVRHILGELCPSLALPCNPIILGKYARRVSDMDDQVISLYSRGLSTREICAFIEEHYGIEASPELVSNITESVLKDVEAWQNRPLETVYPVVFFDALRVRIRSGVGVKPMSVYLALGINCQGQRDVLGMWVNETEGASFWAGIFTELQTRGVEDILIAVTDGLTGMTKAIETVFPHAEHQTCIVHLIRNSTAFISHKDRPAVCAALKTIYQAVSAEEAEKALAVFEETALGKRYKVIGEMWHRSWTQVVPFFRFPPEIRRLIYTTNSIEALNRGIRKVIKTRTVFPTTDAAKKLIFLAIRNITKDWSRASIRWSSAMPHFAILYGERFTRGIPLCQTTS